VNGYGTMNRAINVSSMPGVRHQDDILTQRKVNTWFEMEYRDPLPFPPSLAFMYNKGKHMCEIRKAMGASKLDFLSSQDVDEPHTVLPFEDCLSDANIGAAHCVNVVPLTYVMRNDMVRVSNKN